MLSGAIASCIAEAVADRHHAGDVPDLADQRPAERGGLRIPLYRHHAGLDRHPELARADEVLVPEDASTMSLRTSSSVRSNTVAAGAERCVLHKSGNLCAAPWPPPGWRAPT